jgi:hypothetical protein
VKDPDWTNELYPHGNRRRDKYAWFVSEGTESTSSSTISHDLHRLRRSAVAPNFSKRSIVAREPMINSTLETLFKKLETYAGTGQPVTLGTMFASFTVDLVLQIWYGAPEGLPERWDFFPNWDEAIDPPLSGSHFLRHFPWSFTMMSIIPRSYMLQMKGIGFILNLQKASHMAASRTECVHLIFLITHLRSYRNPPTLPLKLFKTLRRVLMAKENCITSPSSTYSSIVRSLLRRSPCRGSATKVSASSWLAVRAQHKPSQP